LPRSDTTSTSTTGVSDALGLRRPLGATGLHVSPVALGTMQLGWTVTDVQGMRLLDAYRDAGGNLVDTANMYGGDQTVQEFAPKAAHVGGSEDVVGRRLASRGCRDDLVVTTKVRARMWPGEDGEGLTRRHIVRAVEDSLRRLRTDHVDVLYAHWPDPDAVDEEWLEVFGELVRAGKVRHAGTSNFCGFDDFGDLLTPLLRKAAEDPSLARVEVEQPRFNLLNRGEYEGSGLQRLAVEQRLGIVTYSSLASGFLTGRFRPDTDTPSERAGFVEQYCTPAGWHLLDGLDQVARAHDAPVAAVALAWTLAQPGVTSTIVGPESVAELADVSLAPRLDLTSEELAMLDQRSWTASQPEFVTW